MYPFFPRPCFMNCQSSGLSSFTDSCNLSTSSSSEKNAPCEQQPSSGRPAMMPWQAGVPNTQVQLREQPRHVRGDGVLGVIGIEELHPFPSEVEPNLGARRHLVRRPRTTCCHKPPR